MSFTIKQLLRTCNNQPFLIQVRYSRFKPFVPVYQRKLKPHLYYSLKERLEEKDETLKDSEKYKKVNIGFSKEKKDIKSQKWSTIKKIKKDEDLERRAREGTLQIDLDAVEKEWIESNKPEHIKALAENSEIFKHLFGDYAYFYPVVNMEISYDYDEEYISPVYAGNLLKPKETVSKPSVKFESKENELWTLILTNPDGNLMDNEAEMIHWFIGNIQGNDLNKGEEVVDYMRPIPPKGTGFHRYCFILYKQNGKIDYSSYRKKSPCKELQSRTFKTFDFYREFENALTPAGLAWFQADYDLSLKDFFKNTLEMKEPHYEYEFPKPFIAPQRHFPMQKPFNRYMDLHRDPKETQKLMLLKRLARVHPFQGEKPLLPFPHAITPPHEWPVWRKNELQYERDGEGKYKYMYRGDDRPYIPSRKEKKRPFFDIKV